MVRESRYRREDDHARQNSEKLSFHVGSSLKQELATKVPASRFWTAQLFGNLERLSSEVNRFIIVNAFH